MTAAESDLERRQFDVIVIGGGINGSGIARDAALRGLSVLLVDKSDVSAGTTSWSSRLIHGGLRYLEHAEIGLVRESLRERENLLRIAPHLVKPLPLTLPIYTYHKRGALTIRAGMLAYDALSFDKSLPRHRMFSRRAALAHEPGLNPEGLKAAARYYDAQIEFPERISVENMLDAIAHGAIVRTHSSVTGLIVENGVVRGVELTDGESNHPRNVRGKVTVNVSGPWVDAVLDGLSGEAAPPPLIGATKGSHIVVDPFPGAPVDALYIEARQDGRPYFIIPWNELYLIGTTDVRYDGDLDNVVPSEEEIRYLLDETNIAIPSARLDRDDVRYAYAGLRPLPHQRNGTESAITRRHIVKDHAPRFGGIVSIVGGKLTTFRSLAGHAVDVVLKKLDQPPVPSRTADSMLPGAVGRFAAFSQQFHRDRPDWLSERSAGYLLRVYGIRARDVVALGGQERTLREPLDSHTGAIGAAAVFAVTEERAETLTDILMRRTMIGYSRTAGLDAVESTLDVVHQVLGWDETRVAEERARHLTYMQRFLPRSVAAAATRT